MSIWWLIPAFVGLVGVLMLVGGIMAVFRAKLGSGLMRVLFGGLTLAGAMIVGLIGLNLQTYTQLSKERLAGQVTLKKVSDYNYTATVDLADETGKLRGQPHDFQVTGQRIHIEGPVVKFKPWANVIGMDSLFRVAEVYGSYVNPNCSNKYPSRRETTDECVGGDFFGCLGTSWKLLNLADFSHTSASGQLMADGAVYDIYASQDAFELKPSPSNKVAMDLQSQIAPQGPADCDPVTTPVETPAGAVEYRAPANAPVVSAPVRPQVVAPAPPPIPESAPILAPAAPAPSTEPAAPEATIPPG
jgi:hypothetical protein